MKNIIPSFASTLVDDLCKSYPYFSPNPDNHRQAIAKRDNGTIVSLDLRPFVGQVYPADANSFFANVSSVSSLILAYENIQGTTLFENGLPGAMDHIDQYAEKMLESIFHKAKAELTNKEAKRIAAWLRHLDKYTAIKSLESLLNSPADRIMLEVAEQQGWSLLFDHLAIRCGIEERGDALRVVEFLCNEHGYRSAQTASEKHYRFDDGWDACPLYKQLNNGLVLRLFIDESSTGYPAQIIQHWNRVYGYTAHHLALRAVQKKSRHWQAVRLKNLSDALARNTVVTLQPTGDYTHGLLEQVFTPPTQMVDVPKTVKMELQKIDPDLPRLISNGKLIELVSRREMPPVYAEQLYLMNGIHYEPDNPLHSSPLYSYFLPAQAAHVIKTSIQ